MFASSYSPVSRVSPSPTPFMSPSPAAPLTSPSPAPQPDGVTPVIISDGRIFHPCHGLSSRALTIFDLFPGIVKYQSKRYTERDRIAFLLSHSARSFHVAVDESAMWLTALKYLLSDTAQRPFDQMSPRLTFALRSHVSSAHSRTSLLTSIYTHGFAPVLHNLYQDLLQRMNRESRARREAQLAYDDAAHQLQMAEAAHAHYHRSQYCAANELTFGCAPATEFAHPTNGACDFEHGHGALKLSDLEQTVNEIEMEMALDDIEAVNDNRIKAE